MAMPAFEDVILKKQWVPTHMVRIMLLCMPVTLKRYVQNKEKTKCGNANITWLFYVEAVQSAVTPVVQNPNLWWNSFLLEVIWFERTAKANFRQNTEETEVTNFALRVSTVIILKTFYIFYYEFHLYF